MVGGDVSWRHLSELHGMDTRMRDQLAANDGSIRKTGQ
jgi:hypothetical protein